MKSRVTLVVELEHPSANTPPPRTSCGTSTDDPDLDYDPVSDGEGFASVEDWEEI